MQVIDTNGISFIDSSKVFVCNNKRIRRNNVFKEITEAGKSTMEWFYGFKLHIDVNDKDELLNFVIATGNVDGRELVKDERFLEKNIRKIFCRQRIYRERTL
jgi:hypothetical protein